MIHVQANPAKDEWDAGNHATVYLFKVGKDKVGAPRMDSTKVPSTSAASFQSWFVGHARAPHFALPRENGIRRTFQCGAYAHCVGV